MGNLQEVFPSEVIVRILGEDYQLRYHQTNIYRPEKGSLRTIEAFGEIRDGRVWFSSERYDGWAMDLPEDAPGRGCLIVMRSHDGTSPDVHEIFSLSEDGRRRCRSTQFLKAGRLVGRTLIDEEKLSDDWRARDSDWAMP